MFTIVAVRIMDLRTIKQTRFLLGIGMLLVLVRSVVAQDSPDLLEYLANIEEYKSIEYSAVMLQDPDPEVQVEMRSGLQVRRRFAVKYDFVSQNYFLEEKSYIRGKDVWFRQLVSYIDGEKRGYMDADSTALKVEKSGPLNAVIESANDRQEMEGVEKLLGEFVASRYRKRLHLKQLLTDSKIDNNGACLFEVKNVFRWEESFQAAIDLKLTLAKDFGFLPSEIEFLHFNRVNNEHHLDWKGRVLKFHQDPATGLWVPIDIEFSRRGSGTTRVQVDPQSIVINKCPNSDYYAFEFPKGRIVDNLLTKQRLIDGVVVKKIELAPKPFDNLLSNRLKFGGAGLFGLGIAVAIGFFLIRRSRGALSILVVLGAATTLPTFSGCGIGTVRRSEASSEAGEVQGKDWYLTNSSGEQVLKINGGRQRDLIVDLNAYDRKSPFKFELMNTGSDIVVFDDFIHTTCGCTIARLSRQTIASGESAILEGAIESAEVPGERYVQVKIKLKEPSEQELALIVHATFSGDWVCLQKKICFTGSIGSSSSEILEIQGTSKALAGMEVVGSGLTLKEIAATTTNRKSFQLTRTIESTIFEQIV
ncbi:MAG: DUF1573 domain-containing protein [Planctomycetota bacterium]|nr:DUF1573 domain-containing protein [Planctomycetota bacterium]